MLKLPFDEREQVPRAIASSLAFIVAVWVIYYALKNPIAQRRHANVVLGLGLASYYAKRGYEYLHLDYRSWWNTINLGVVFLFSVLILLATAYVHISYSRWLQQGRLLIYSNLDLLVGIALIVIVIDATFRRYGKALGAVIVGTIIYGYLGPYMPGILGHAGMTAEEIIRRQTITLTGIYGFLIQVGATWIAIFVVFAGLVEGFGGFEYLVSISQRVKHRFRSGVAQTAVVSSMIMGMMMGASASNVATTGSFTIPLMEEHELPSRFAAAAEAVASTGGQILPPIMGTAAFIMADIINVPYAEVTISAIIPALLFYFATALGVHFTVIGNGWDKDFSNRESREQGEILDVDDLSDASKWDFFTKGLQYFVPLVVLVYSLMIQKLSPSTAGLYTIGSLFITAAAASIYEGEIREFLYNSLEGLKRGGRNLAPFMGLFASLGIVINIFSVTGLAQRIATVLGIWGAGNFWAIIVIAMIVALLLGFGMPTPAAYVLIATILAPILVEVGITEMTAHLFLFYFALLSALTPPVALAVSVGIGISGSDFLTTAKEALKLGGPTFLIPYLFLVHPSIIHWSFPDTIINLLLMTVAIVALVYAFTGFAGQTKLSLAERVIGATFFTAIGFAPSLGLRVVSAGIFVVVGGQFYRGQSLRSLYHASRSA